MKLSMLASIITFSIIATTISQASIQAPIASAKTPYGNMTTAQLQVAVENHSMTGKLSFEAGQELMERWSTSNESVEISYIDMTTAQLQVAVESHSISGKPSFSAGKELMKRWSQS